MKLVIKLIEDQSGQMKTIKEALERRYREVEVETFETERGFRDYLKAFGLSKTPPPKVVISDVMVRWDDPKENPDPLPDDVSKGSFREAGIRCWKQARKMGLKSVPWVYFTVLDADTIRYRQNKDDLTSHVQKSGTLAPLFAELDDLFALNEDWRETDQQETESLLRSPKMRAALLEGMAAPLELCATSLA